MIVQLRGTRRRWHGLIGSIMAVEQIVILYEADGRWFAAGELIARHYAQAVRAGGRFDSFNHGQASLRLHREHRSHAWRIQIGIDDSYFAPFQRQSHRDIDGEHALADSAARARKGNR